MILVVQNSLAPTMVQGILVEYAQSKERVQVLSLDTALTYAPESFTHIVVSSTLPLADLERLQMRFSSHATFEVV